MHAALVSLLFLVTLGLLQPKTKLDIPFFSLSLRSLEHVFGEAQVDVLNQEDSIHR